ncbi:hypothetical protein TS65_01285 [Aneurinibacillus migulanus]|uniref:Transposase n=1 Tax=Aneurinibacillus migulanus TaxID=47500 RepID=A0A0D1WN49_ANEMI|nr:hypothetical protein TS65_01285 [Aneurinibacillus migulanus]KON96809.1 hypothetical protein AF333_16300 [Aneurinibacillus migulanus]
MYTHYTTRQLVLAMDIEIVISDHHLCRIVDAAVEKEGLVKLEDYFLDGTEIEANANKYTFVWRKSTEKYDQKLDEKFQQIVTSIEEVTREDEQAEKETDFQGKWEETPITSEKIEDKQPLKSIFR